MRDPGTQLSGGRHRVDSRAEQARGIDAGGQTDHVKRVEECLEPLPRLRAGFESQANATMVGPLAQRGDRGGENLATFSVVLGWNPPDPGEHQVRPQLVGQGKRQSARRIRSSSWSVVSKLLPGGQTEGHEGKLHRPQQVPEFAAARLAEALR